MAKFDDIFLHIGDFGRSQKRAYVLLNLLTMFHCCQIYLLVFLDEKPQWQCSEKERSFVDEATQRQGYPCYKNGSRCQNIKFEANFSSVTTEWLLVCDQEYKINVAQSVIMSGCLAGSILFSTMADKYGRKFAIILLQSLVMVFSLASAFAQSFTQFVVLRFLTTAAITGSKTAIFVHISEILGNRVRDMLLTAYHGFYACGFIALATLAYFIRDWRTLTFMISLPYFVLFIFLWYFIPESPQWLLETGRVNEAKQVLRSMAKKNSCAEISDKHLEKLSAIKQKANVAQTKGSQNLQSTTRSTGSNVKNICILTMLWFLIPILYGGLSFGSKSSGGNKYISFSLSGLVEIPSLILSSSIIRSGRKRPLFSLSVACSVACLVCCWVGASTESQGSLLLAQLSAMLGKSAVAASYSILYICSTEMFPANILGSTMGIFSISSRVSYIFAPLVANLELYDKRLPMFVLSLVATCSALLVLPLPETLPVIKREELKAYKTD